MPFFYHGLDVKHSRRGERGVLIILSQNFFQLYENAGCMPNITTSNNLNDSKGGRYLEIT